MLQCGRVATGSAGNSRCCVFTSVARNSRDAQYVCKGDIEIGRYVNFVYLIVIYFACRARNDNIMKLLLWMCVVKDLSPGMLYLVNVTSWGTELPCYPEVKSVLTSGMCDIAI